MSKELDMSAMENCVCFNLRWVTRVVTNFLMQKCGVMESAPRRGRFCGH